MNGQSSGMSESLEKTARSTSLIGIADRNVPHAGMLFLAFLLLSVATVLQ